MSNRAITISRKFGSGGRAIGRKDDLPGFIAGKWYIYLLKSATEAIRPS